MLINKDETRYPISESNPSGNSYFGNPYALVQEQYGLEHLDRNKLGSDDIESVAILGYN